MIVLDAMDLEAGRTIHGEGHACHWRQEGKHHGCRRRGRQAFVAGEWPLMLAERESDLPLNDRLHQQPHHREHGQRRTPFRFLQPHRADGGRSLDPAKARFHRDMWLLSRLE